MASRVCRVTVTAYNFDCMPGHFQITSRGGTGSTVRTAAARAMESIFLSPDLKRKRIKTFKAAVVIEPTEIVVK